jgi:hypothetical protein
MQNLAAEDRALLNDTLQSARALAQQYCTLPRVEGGEAVPTHCTVGA